MNGNFYLVDNNALVGLGRKLVRTAFFAKNCRITSDVLHEARGHKERAKLHGLVEPVTPAVLAKLREVMAGIAIGDTTLVDLYNNKGAADPGLIATVLAHRASEDGLLFPDIWTIVTLDRAVLEAARGHQIPTIPPSDLADLIDASKSV